MLKSILGVVFCSACLLEYVQPVLATPIHRVFNDIFQTPSFSPHTNSQANTKAWTLFSRMTHGAYTIPDAPSVAVHANSHFIAHKPLHIVVYLHGYRGCIQVLMNGGNLACRTGGPLHKGWHLAHQHEIAGTNTLLVLPQLAYMKRDGNPGCFKKEGCFRNFIVELLSQTIASRIGRSYHMKDIAGITLVAHSAGFETALAIIKNGNVTSLLQNIVLLDALYSGVKDFTEWLTRSTVKNSRLISIYLGNGKTYKNSHHLYARLGKLLGNEKVKKVASDDLITAIRSYRVVVSRARTSHRLIPEKYLADVLKALY